MPKKCKKGGNFTDTMKNIGSTALDVAKTVVPFVLENPELLLAGLGRRVKELHERMDKYDTVYSDNLKNIQPTTTAFEGKYSEHPEINIDAIDNANADRVRARNKKGGSIRVAGSTNVGGNAHLRLADILRQ